MIEPCADDEAMHDEMTEGKVHGQKTTKSVSGFKFCSAPGKACCGHSFTIPIQRIHSDGIVEKLDYKIYRCSYTGEMVGLDEAVICPECKREINTRVLTRKDKEIDFAPANAVLVWNEVLGFWDFAAIPEGYTLQQNHE